MTSLVLFVVAVLSCAFAAQLLEQLIHETGNRAHDLAEQVFYQAKHSLVEAAQQGLHPDSDAPKEIHDYVRHAFEVSEGLRTQLASATVNRLIYEVSITDTDGLVLASTDENLPGKVMPRRASLSQLAGRSFLHHMRVLLAPTKPQLFEVEYAFINAGKPFGEVRVVVDSALLVQEIRSSLRIGGIIVLVAILVSTLLAAILTPHRSPTCAPVRRLSEINRYDKGRRGAACTRRRRVERDQYLGLRAGVPGHWKAFLQLVSISVIVDQDYFCFV